MPRTFFAPLVLSHMMNAGPQPPMPMSASFAEDHVAGHRTGRHVAQGDRDVAQTGRGGVLLDQLPVDNDISRQITSPYGIAMRTVSTSARAGRDASSGSSNAIGKPSFRRHALFPQRPWPFHQRIVGFHRGGGFLARSGTRLADFQRLASVRAFTSV